MTCFILATGPSQNQGDVDAVRGKGIVIAVNNAVFMAPWADILYASDSSWWQTYNPEWFEGERLTINPRCAKYGATALPFRDAAGFGRDVIHTGYNSGFQAINVALLRGYDPICLLGFDHQHTGGRRHCFGDHPDGMGNAAPVKLWQRTMAAAAKTATSTIINCTRETALDCFPRMALEQFLEHLDSGRVFPAPQHARNFASVACDLPGDREGAARPGHVAGSEVVSESAP